MEEIPGEGKPTPRADRDLQNKIKAFHAGR